jgi:hypothetical protein
MILKELSGPEVIIFDDMENEIISIENSLKGKEINFKFIKLDIADDDGLKLIPNLKLIFLDLHYGNQFVPDLCANYISKVVPTGKQYHLVIWTKDPDKASELIELLRDFNIAPVDYSIKHKEKYRSGSEDYYAEKLLSEIERDFDKAIEVENIKGQIVDIEKDHVLINCLIEEEPPVFQVRRFDIRLFTDYVHLENGAFVTIIVTTKPGSRRFEFFTETRDLNKQFERPDYFEELGDISFLNGEE